MHKPISTYRIQFHKDFKFSDFEKIIPYLHRLGIETIYASPIFTAIPGSTHGYDSVDPTNLNPEIGDEKQLLKISKQLKRLGMHWIQDIVPNHMAFHPNNAWLMDVLRKGSSSSYFKYFDIGSPLGNENEKLMVPFLGSSLEEAIANKAIKIVLDQGELKLEAGDSKWPLNTESSSLISKHQSDESVDKVNEDPELLLEILNAQHYRLCNWQETDKAINYRRFFTVNALICLNVQDPEVFDWYHQYTLRLIKLGVIDGLRIDHIDGLFDPEAYLQRLRDAVGDDIYIVAEKILHRNEEMPTNWPIQGSTGYDFLSMVNNLLTNKGAERSFSKSYEKFTGKKVSAAEQVAKKKADILYGHMAGELDNLTQLFIQLELANKDEITKVTAPALKEAIANFLIYCPVYRYYGNSFPLNASEQKLVDSIFRSIPKNKEIRSALKLLRAAILTKPANDSLYAEKATLFYQRCMQFSGPLAAKGVEDTLMYTYNRFIGHDEVGDSPEFFGLRVSDFHKLMENRQKAWPLSLNGTSTHDTKRGEDVRARLNVLTAIPTVWAQWLSKIDKFEGIHQNDLFLIYQSLIGIWPMPGEKDEKLADRVTAYLEKALREAKKRSNWASPDESYEELVKQFAVSLLERSPVEQFSEEIADSGIVNSLAQVLLKLTCPGVPDFYQGTELWDLSMVDPDNRKPVDYPLREKNLQELSALSLAEIWKQRYNGKIKLWLTQVGLAHRKEYREIYENGDYLPLKTKGKYAEHIFAFARCYQEKWTITIIPLGITENILEFNWEDTRLELPSNAPSIWDNIFTENRNVKDISTNSVFVKSLFTQLPFAILKSGKADRGAGLLLPISSLSSPFGIGDLGSESYSFIDFLAASKQKYWQILPLNPTTKEQSHSPYSSQSSMAGNVLVISPELLQEDGLLSSQELKPYLAAETETIDYKKVEKIKEELLAIAYTNFSKGKHELLKADFLTFCENESAWLNDYVLYLAIKKDQEQEPWDKWPTELKNREPSALEEILSSHQSFIEEQQWRQFIFHRQWFTLKEYAKERGVQFIGDLPFYVAFDSAEVWANPALFKLDENSSMQFCAGVPPDYFNANGQLWGMPIFNWEEHRAQKYSWWIDRIKKNLQLTDVLRLDHFRAFDSYWQIPAQEHTAINGKWEPGPGAEFFEVLKKNIGDLPFIAEDLGESSTSLTALLDKTGLPGMKVLQFAFDEEMIVNQHIPHQFAQNFIVYTGTHDNNTTRGWFTTTASSFDRKRLAEYTGKTVKANNVHEIVATLAFQSVAKICILPVQDLLGLDAKARINTPSSIAGNWVWKLEKNQLNLKVQRWLQKQTEMSGRD